MATALQCPAAMNKSSKGWMEAVKVEWQLPYYKSSKGWMETALLNKSSKGWMATALLNKSSKGWMATALLNKSSKGLNWQLPYWISPA